MMIKDFFMTKYFSETFIFMQIIEFVIPQIIQSQTVSVISQTESIIPAAIVHIHYIHSHTGLSTAAHLLLAALRPDTSSFVARVPSGCGLRIIF